MRTKSIDSARYFATFIYRKSRWTEVYFLKSKDEVKEAFIQYKSLVENQKDCKIQILRSDNGLEYRGKWFDRELEKAGIKREYTIPHTPQQNGVSKRKNRTIVEMARCLLSQANLPDEFWAEAVSTAMYIRNRCPTKILGNRIPFESWFGRKPNVSHFKTFGCKAYVLNKDPTRGKLESKSKEHIFLGYANDAKAYRLWNPETKKVVKSRDIKAINEYILTTDQTPMTKEDYVEEMHQDKQSTSKNESIKDDASENNIKGNQEDDLRNEECTDSEMDTERGDTNLQDFTTPKHGSGRPKLLKTGERGRPRKIYQPRAEHLDIPKIDATQHNVQMAYSAIGDITVEEALSGAQKQEWEKAMVEEYEALVNFLKTPKPSIAAGY